MEFMEFSHIVPSLLHTYLVYLLLSENICLRPKRDATWIFSRPWIMVAFQIRKSRILDATFLTVFTVVLFSCLGFYLTLFSIWGQILRKAIVYSSEFLQECECSERIWCNCLTKCWQWLVIYQDCVLFVTFLHFIT